MIALVTIFFCSGFYVQGMVAGHDIIYELVRVAEYATALSDSGFPVRWAANLDSGHGNPTFIFYSPLFLFVSSCQVLIGLSIVAAVKITLFLFTLIGGIGMYHLASLYFNREGARLASFMFLLFPYKFVDMYVRNAFAEYSAMALAPFVFFGLALISRDKTLCKKSFLLLVVSGTLFALSHNLSLVMYTPLFGAFFLLNLILNKNIHGLKYGVLAGLQIFFLSSFFILPALLEVQFVQHSQLHIDRFNVFNNFSTIGDLFGFSKWYSITPIPIFSYLMVSGLILFKKHSFDQITYSSIIFCLVSILTGIFLITSFSKAVWEIFPFMQYLQFPWRLLSPVTFLISFITGSIGHFCLRNNKSKKNSKSNQLLKTLMNISFVILLSILIFMFLDKNSDRFLFFSDEYFSEENIREQNLRATVLSEYHPIWVLEKSESTHFNEITADNGCDLKIINQNAKATLHEYSVHLKKSCWVTAHVHYFPGWKVYANGSELPVTINKKGLISFPLPAGTQNLKIMFQDTKVRKMSVLLSIIGVITIGLFLYIFNDKEHVVKQIVF
jgi:hypothetical protein